MGSFLSVLAVQSRRLVRRVELKFAITLMLVLSLAGFVETCVQFYAADVGAIPSAAYGWAWNMDSMQVQSMRVLAFLLVFLVAASVFADNLLVDARSGVAASVVSRCSKASYVIANAFLSFVGGFLIMLVPLAVLQLLALVAFPLEGSFDGDLNVPAYLGSKKAPLFGALATMHPYLNNVVYMIYASAWAGVASVASFAVSLYTRKRLVVLGAPTLFFLLCWQLSPVLVEQSDRFAHFYYMYPYAVVSGLTETCFFASPLVVLAMSIAAIAVALRAGRDFLL